MTPEINFSWSDAAAAVARAFPREALRPAVVAAADARLAGEPWCVAFSGGADSLALLLLLWAHWPERSGALTAVHFNHGLRGAESDGDEQFCREVCAVLGIGFGSARWIGAPDKPNEAETRVARQAFFRGEMSARGASVLWTGHQKDDIAETQLMRLARGAGPAGLAAPRPVGIFDDGRVFLRPLLSLGKTEIEKALREAGVVWREDASNATRDYFRNRIRYDVLPRWQDAACASVLGGAALSRELCEEDDVALEAWLAELKIVASDTRLDLRPLGGKPRALWRRALRGWAPVGALSRAGFEELLALCERGAAGRVSLHEGFAVVAEAVVRWEAPLVSGATPWASLALRADLPVQLPDGATLVARRVIFDAALLQRVQSGGVDCTHEAFLGEVDLPLVVRAWLPGDRFRPLGAPGSAKLQNLFVNRKIPVERRGVLPVICAPEGGILWVPGFPPAETARVNDHTALGLQLTYLGGTSTLRP